MTKFLMSVDIYDLITIATFGDDRLRGFGVARGWISGCLASSPLQHSHYRASVLSNAIHKTKAATNVYAISTLSKTMTDRFTVKIGQ